MLAGDSEHLLEPLLSKLKSVIENNRVVAGRQLSQSRSQVLHHSGVSALNNLAILYSDQGKLQEAEEMYMRALRGYENAWGPDHASLLDTMNNLANLYCDRGKLQEAEEMYLWALRGYWKAVGTEEMNRYPPALNTMQNLGTLFKVTGKSLTLKRCTGKPSVGWKRFGLFKFTRSEFAKYLLPFKTGDAGKAQREESTRLRSHLNFEQATIEKRGILGSRQYDVV
ncbi:NB-ARC and TPR domain-containing protein [Seiridium cupressi]